MHQRSSIILGDDLLCGQPPAVLTLRGYPAGLPCGATLPGATLPGAALLFKHTYARVRRPASCFNSRTQYAPTNAPLQMQHVATWAYLARDSPAEPSPAEHSSPHQGSEARSNRPSAPFGNAGGSLALRCNTRGILFFLRTMSGMSGMSGVILRPTGMYKGAHQRLHQRSPIILDGDLWSAPRGPCRGLPYGATPIASLQYIRDQFSF